MATPLKYTNMIIKFKSKINYITEPIIEGAYIIHFKNKVYVGSSKNVLKRLKGHRSLLRSKKHQYYDIIKDEFNEDEIYFSIYPTEYYLEMEMLLIEKYTKLGISLNKQVGNKTVFMSREKYTKVKVLKITEIQHQTLKKLDSYGVNVAQFIRDALSDKIKREYKDLLPKPKKEYCPF